MNKSNNSEIRELFEISIGSFTLSKRWKRVETTWPKLLKRLAKTTRTHETVRQFQLMKTAGKDGRKRRQEIKDVGGFVGGELATKQRKKSTILTRSILTLDLDHIEISTSDLWDIIIKTFPEVEIAMYSTHSHTPGEPKLRLIIPFSRNVSPAEYIPIGRKVADMIGIEMFDTTTYQAERFMYWPSTSKDGEFIFKRNKGEYLDPETVLGYYADWQDINEWPISVKESKLISGGIDTQQDPLEKKGVIGAFCRCFTIQAAISTFLSDTYENGAVPDRYTYINGSSYNGLAVYDNKFAYSHHGTDPAGGVLCNAFDLVRLHKFGKLDGDSRDKTDTTKLPSYRAMTDFCIDNGEVRKQLGKEKLEAANEYFSDLFDTDSVVSETDGKEVSSTRGVDGVKAGKDGKTKKTGNNKNAGTSNEYSIDLDITPTEVVENDDWLEKIKYDKAGNKLCTIENFYLILENDPHFKDAFALDLFSQRIVAKNSLKWRGKDNQVQDTSLENAANFETLVNITEDSYQYIDDADLTYIRFYMETIHEMPYHPKKLEDAISVCAQKHCFHPIRDYLNSIEWDGVERIKYLFHDYMGAVNSPYLRAVSEIFFTAAVSRIFRPGCKFDYMVVLIGEQGAKKSSLISVLTAPWFSDSLYSMGDKSSFEQIQGSWAVEVAELSAMKRSDVDAVKNFITKRTDKFRPAFGRMVKNYSRSCVFFGTGNNDKFLKDDTGNRRFWPIKIGEVEPKLSLIDNFTYEDRNQIWAEAVQLYKNGQKLYLPNDLELIAKKVQAGFMEVDGRLPLVEEFINTPLPSDWDEMAPIVRGEWYRGLQNGENVSPGFIPRKKVCAYEVAMELFQMSVKECTNFQIRQINTILKMIEGLTPNKSRYRWYGQQRGFELPTRQKK